ncbi:16S rRNA (uracil(1498)-N(3))-methyltransferase [Listeria ivanovii]|uniref:Ribosomal RNA small subunit methyltransferase E n=2 Tax=Listeria ivanovii TaxID=1638 RepID=A0ABS1G6S4_LISIV|nr:16S rRNA (uracil(1498)-N(3))-methyltransferase [Listeria ivanovii]AIS59874.1 16S rRNA methyltransferase [Listeria ivanovii subsp. londoniensis]AIS62702.1 16S rRNA methyltransferase [Listeria ivanovii subsp. londoniensis]MBC2254265.1 16S rRNA (uracil(1498)-N(3))-methyltransferase [Listeria ivanovii]MBK1962593.1 16S rRNA (uracil(1498)-N(3))-methyltransferase [Listeria ivanovii subsp. londoniensis]MBK1967285.1 16S rRNA (uracil(1498)-N(3))-methyltransferase [Listeria ivanovii subsp. londoniensi
MQRYFVNQELENDSEPIRIIGENFHHITRVMRMKPNDQVYVVFSNNQTAIAEITNTNEEEVQLRLVEWLDETTELPIQMTIASGLPKGDKLEFIVQKSTELGAHAFVPFKAERSVVKWDEKKVAKKIERLQKIAQEAAEQSHRTVIPEVRFANSLKELLLNSDSFDYIVVAYEESAREGEDNTLSTLFKEVTPNQSVLFIFGPEGGISEKELFFMQEKGVKLAGLGPRILRTETAPLYVLSATSFYFDLYKNKND